MPEPEPIACSLGPTDMRRRLAEIATLAGRSLIAAETNDGIRLLRFRDDDETRRRLTAIVAAEGECCPFLDLQVTADNQELLLSITAPDDAKPVIDQLAAAFVAGSSGAVAGEICEGCLARWPAHR
jgi:hypothetical protein